MKMMIRLCVFYILNASLLLFYGCSADRCAVSGTGNTPRLHTVRPAPEHSTQFDAESWVHFGGAGIGLEVDLPAHPAQSTDTTSSIIGPQTVIRYSGERDGTFFEVGYLIRSDHPMARLAPDSRIMDAARHGTLEHFGAVEISHLNISKSPRIQDVVFSMDRDGSRVEGRLRLIVQPDRIYHLMVIRDRDGNDPSGLIFDSFRILE